MAWQLVGGGKKYETCGKIGFVGCLNVGGHSNSLDGREAGKIYVKAYKRSCDRRECPMCYNSWAWLEASKAAYRLKRFKSGWRCAIHIVVSAPQTLWMAPYRRLRKDAYRIARKSGFKGGILVYHPWRFKPKRFSPHFHMLGYGWIKGTTVKELNKKTGWVVKNFGIRKTIAGTIKYQLSHCGVHVSYHAVTWFGELAYNKLKIPKMPDLEKPYCPICKQTLINLVPLGDRPPPKKAGDYYLDFNDWSQTWSTD